MQTLRATMTASQLDAAIAKARRYPHKHLHKGELIISPEAFETKGRETNLVISPYSILDCTGSIHIGAWCNIGPRTRIYTHDTIHAGVEPLFLLEETHGVHWQDKYIGKDVWIHDGAVVLYQVTHIPDGAVVGAGAVLTKNPGAYEIWAGNPARKIGVRKKTDAGTLSRMMARDGFSLEDLLQK